jgi:peptidoglycan/xylan/chitin deacetylase (PgdA/CDA1 family)
VVLVLRSRLLLGLAAGLLAVGLIAAAGDALAARPQAPVLWRVDTAAPEVALTFDDGPNPTYTPQVLATLTANGAVGTFFVLGTQVQRYPALVRDEAATGSEVCPHGWQHVTLRGRSAAFVRTTVTRTADSLSALGVAPCHLFRFPYFASDAASRRAVSDLGYRIVAADVDTQDWQRPGAGTMAQQVLAHLRAGDIILFHDGGGNRSQTVRALQMVLAGLAAKGLKPVTVSTLLASAQRAPAAGGGPGPSSAAG